MKRRSSSRPFGFVRERTGRASPYLAGFNPPGGGQEVTKAFVSETAAEVWLAEQHVAVARGAFVNPDGAKTLLGDYWKVWLTERQLAPSSRVTYAGHGRAHILPAFGSPTARKPPPQRASGLVQPAAGRPSHGQDHPGCAPVLPESGGHGRPDPQVECGWSAGSNARRRGLVVPSNEEVEVLAAAIFGRYAVAVRLAAEAGLRQGELLGLRVGDLDQLGRRLTVARQAQTIPGQGVLLDQPPKSDAGYRTVPLARETVDTVALHLAAYPPRAGLVLTTSAGTPVHRQVFSDAWTKAKQRAGVSPSLRFHDLRHRYASVLIAEGLDALTVKTLMGHSSITETYDTYGHLFPNQSERAAAAISAAIHPRSRTAPRTAEGETADQSS